MTTLKAFEIEQVHSELSDEVSALCSKWGHNLLKPDDREACVAACSHHDGMVMRAPDGAVIGSCFVSRRELRFHRPTHWAPDVQPVTYVSRFVLAKPYRGLGLGRDLLRSTVAFEYGRSEDFLPDIVGVCFAGASDAIKAFDAVGVYRFPESSFEARIYKAAFAVKDMVEKNRQVVEFPGATEILVLNPDMLPTIARWAVSAYEADGAYDTHHGTVVRIQDRSEGRSGIVRQLKSLADQNPDALARIGLLVPPSKPAVSLA